MDVDIRPDFLPVISPVEVAVSFRKQRSHTVASLHDEIQQEITDHHTCGIAYVTKFRGLFDDVGFNQTMLDSKTYAGLPDTLLMEKVYETVVEQGGPVRLAINKFVDEKGRHRYDKYVDFDVDKILELGGHKELRKVIYLLIQACDVDGTLVPKVNESWMDKEDTCESLGKPQTTRLLPENSP